MSNWRRHRAFIGEKVPENGPFRDQFSRGVGHLAPLRGKSHNKPYTDELQILSSLCMPRHDFATAVEVATPDQLRDRVGCAYLIYTAQGVRAAGLQLTPLIYARIWNSGCIN